MSSIRVLFATTVALVAFSEGQAGAESGLQIEVREPTKARLVAADVWIRTLKGAVVRKVYAAAGRVKVANAPVGTFDLEARSRLGNLVGRTRVVVKPNALARVVIAAKPAPTKRVAARVTRGPAPAPGPTARQRPGGRATLTRRATVRRSAVRRRSTGSSTVVKTPSRTVRTTPPPTTKSTAKRPRVARAAVGGNPRGRAVVAQVGRDWGKGKVRVCRGDVFDAKGRRISGRIQLYSGKNTIGFANVVSGYFSLYDLKTATYQLRFSTKDGAKRVTSNVAIISGKLGRVVLKAQ